MSAENEHIPTNLGAEYANTEANNAGGMQRCLNDFWVRSNVCFGSEAEVTNTQNLSMRTAATWCKADIVTQDLSRSRSLGAR